MRLAGIYHLCLSTGFIVIPIFNSVKLRSTIFLNTVFYWFPMQKENRTDLDELGAVFVKFTGTGDCTVPVVRPRDRAFRHLTLDRAEADG